MLTSGLATTATSVGSLASQQKKSKIRLFVAIWNYQEKNEKSLCFFFFFFFFLHRVNVAWNEFTVPSRRSEGQKWSGQPFESWRNFDRWPPRGQILGRPLYIMRLFPTKMLYFNAPFFPIKCSIPSRKSLKMPPIMLIIQRLFSLIVAF